MAKRKRRRRRRRGGGSKIRYRDRPRRSRRSNPGGGKMSGTNKAYIAATGWLYGYVEEKHAAQFAKIPQIDAIGKDLTVAIAAHYLAKQFNSKWLDRLSCSTASIGMYKAGKGGRLLMEGEGSGSEHLSGEVEVVGEDELDDDEE